MKTIHLLSSCLLCILLSSCSSPKIITTQDLPIAGKQYESMTLAPAIEIHGEDLRTNRYSNNSLSNKFYFFDGWDYVSPERSGCSEYKLTLQSESDNKKVYFNVVRNRGDSAFMRWLDCSFSGNSATVYYAAIINSRYIAFLTSDGYGGYVFFDRQKGEFLNTVLMSGLPLQFFLAKDGTVLVYEYGSYRSQSDIIQQRAIDIRSIRIAKIDGLDLTAPFESRDLIEVEKYRTLSDDLWVK